MSGKGNKTDSRQHVQTGWLKNTMIQTISDSLRSISEKSHLYNASHQPIGARHNRYIRRNQKLIVASRRTERRTLLTGFTSFIQQHCESAVSPRVRCGVRSQLQLLLKVHHHSREVWRATFTEQTFFHCHTISWHGEKTYLHCLRFFNHVVRMVSHARGTYLFVEGIGIRFITYLSVWLTSPATINERTFFINVDRPYYVEELRY